MDRSNVITLISKSYTQDALRQQIPVETRRSVFCNLRSVSRSEWAAAGQLGLKADLVATMFMPDYHGEELAEIQISGMTEVEYLADLERQQLYDEDENIMKSESDPEPTAPGTAIRYGVYRTYRGSDETIELYLERKAGVTNG